MIRLIPLFLLILCVSVTAKDYKVGPISLVIPDNYHVENNGEDILLGESGSGSDISSHFNIQIAVLAEIKKSITKPDSLEFLKEAMDSVIEHTKSIAASGYGHEYLSGFTSGIDFNGKVQVIEITGKKYQVYFALIDASGKEEHENLFKKITNQIDNSEI